jgi:hypothetical protein
MNEFRTFDQLTAEVKKDGRRTRIRLARFIREGTANGGWYHDFEAKTPVAA